MAIPNNGKLLIASVQKAIYTWIVSQTKGVIPQNQIIWRDQSKALPPRPCVTMKITDGPTPVGTTDSVAYVAGTTFNLGGQRTMTVSIQVFGNLQVHKPVAYQLAADLHASLSKLTVQDQLRGAGVSAQDRGRVENLTALEETEYEERAQFDVLFGVAENVLDDPSTIETANVTEHVTGP